jgi:hypothetical protein
MKYNSVVTLKETPSGGVCDSTFNTMRNSSAMKIFEKQQEKQQQK